MRFAFVASLMAGLAVAPLVAAESANVMAQGKATAPQPRYLAAGALDFTAILAHPPAPGTPAGLADLEAVLQVQAWRTPEQVAWAQLIDRDTVFNLATELGPWFRAEALPRTAAWFAAIGEDIRWLDGAAKAPFRRARPHAVDPRVQPVVTLPKSFSYPSGSACQAFVWSELLGEIFPERRDELLARAHRAAWGRVIGGVHFPSDVVAGRLLAQAYLAAVRQSDAFGAAQAEARAELRAARGAPAAR
jgi:acid phosphatase (class A)